MCVSLPVSSALAATTLDSIGKIGTAPPPFAAAAAATGSGAPDAGELAALRARIGRHWIRVTCREGTFALPVPELAPIGVWSPKASAYRAKRVALIEGRSAVPAVAPRPIRWESIATIEVGHSRWRDGMKAGLFITGALAIINYSAVWWAASEDPVAASIVFGAVGGTVIATTTLLAAREKRWEQVYVGRGSI